MDFIRKELSKCSENCKVLPNIHFSYTTSGLRSNHQYLPAIIYRIGILACIRAKYLNSNVGIMITASHNSANDNGVKFIDDNGEMLSIEWEKYANEICKTKYEELNNFIEKIVENFKINLLNPSIIYIAQDTRKSGDSLRENLISGISVFPNVQHFNFGKKTTPMFQFLVLKANQMNEIPQESEYYDKIVEGYKIIKNIGIKFQKLKTFVDCANGVGAIILKKLISKIPDLDYIQIKNESSGEVNENCGADYVHHYSKAPENFNIHDEDRCVSFDGDADRIIYFFKYNHKFQVIDGDHAAILLIFYINKLVENLNTNIKIHVAHIAYTNHSVIKYAKHKNIECTCRKIGLKYVFKEVHNFQVVIYFSGNGHGTVLFDEKLIDQLNQIKENNIKMYKPAQILIGLSKIFNPKGTDALANLLSIELILSDLNFSLKDWYEMAILLPKSVGKIETEYTYMFKTSDDDITVLQPENFQDDINKILINYPQSRAFIRPSGTDNFIIIYAESENQEESDEICEKLKSLTIQYLNDLRKKN